MVSPSCEIRMQLLQTLLYTPGEPFKPKCKVYFGVGLGRVVLVHVQQEGNLNLSLTKYMQLMECYVKGMLPCPWHASASLLPAMCGDPRHCWENISWLLPILFKSRWVNRYAAFSQGTRTKCCQTACSAAGLNPCKPSHPWQITETSQLHFHNLCQRAGCSHLSYLVSLWNGWFC